MSLVDFDKLVKLHTEQEFDRPKARVPDQFLGLCKYMPNELFYLVECHTGQVEVLNNAGNKVFKKNGVRFKQIEDLYEVVHPKRLDHFYNYSYNLVELITNDQFELDPYYPQKDTAYTIYRSNTDQMIMRKGFIVSIDTNGAIEYTGGILSNVTDLYPVQN